MQGARIGLTCFSPSAAMRNRIYAALAGIFFLLAIGMAVGKAILLNQPFNLVVSDDRYYYAYLPSVVIDGDLDFSNQILEHWGTDFRPELLENRTETGLVRNKYPIGLPLTLLPGFLVGHVLALISGRLIPADGYSWPYQLFCLMIVELLVWRTLFQIDRLLTERLRVPPGPALLGIIVLAAGTPYAYYACRDPFMVHVVSTFWCTEVVAVTAAGQRGPKWIFPRLAFCGAMALVCRPTNIHLLPVAALGIVQSIRAVGIKRTAKNIPWVAIAILPIGLQVVTWHLQSGAWLYYSYVEEGFNWTHPVLLKTLFSSRHGLFFWSPVLLLAIAGLLFRARDRLILCWFLGAILLWYANSAWYCWWFGDAFGARAFLELSGLFGVGLALSFSWLWKRPWLVAALSVAAVLFNILLMVLYITHRIPRDGYLF
jgi:hypothetical protein